jgi:hypothetical protein
MFNRGRSSRSNSEKSESENDFQSADGRSQSQSIRSAKSQQSQQYDDADEAFDALKQQQKKQKGKTVKADPRLNAAQGDEIEEGDSGSEKSSQQSSARKGLFLNPFKKQSSLDDSNNNPFQSSDAIAVLNAAMEDESTEDKKKYREQFKKNMKYKPPEAAEDPTVNEQIAKQVLEKVSSKHAAQKAKENAKANPTMDMMIRDALVKGFDVDTMRRLPPPQELGIIKGFIVIDDTKSKRYPIYKYYVHDEQGKYDKLVMCCQEEQTKAKITIGKRFLFSASTNFKAEGEDYVGKMSGNFLGSRFTAYDPGEKKSDDIEEEFQRRVVTAIVYEPTIFTLGGSYRKMTCLVPTLYKQDKNGKPRLEKWEAMRDMRHMRLLMSKVPEYRMFDGQWHFCYKYGGRVKIPSKRNFQLVRDNNEDEVVMVFGKLEHNVWVCDYSPPLNAYQTFCIAMSSLTEKLATKW